MVFLPLILTYYISLGAGFFIYLIYCFILCILCWKYLLTMHVMKFYLFMAIWY